MKKVLVVDDEFSIREYYKEFLNDNGYEVILASNGEEGLKAFKSDKPDLVLLDISMPDINGMDILKEMKKTNETIPVFLLTAYEQYKRNFASLYAEEYLVKNKRPEFILKKIKEYMEGIQRAMSMTPKDI
jgi:DNA-binding response OmpR family regulator